MTAAERSAVHEDAEQRLRELRNARAVLLPDQDDAAVLSELTWIQSQIIAAEAALRDTGAGA